MALTFGDVKKLTHIYAGPGGACEDTKEASLFARQVLEYMMLNGAWGSIRRFHFKAVKGCITLPPELETPLQVKIDGRAGTVWNQWMEFQSVTSDLTGQDCQPAGKALKFQPNSVYTAYPLPPTGTQLGVISTCNEDPDAYIIFQGNDVTGREIITTWKGQTVVGEKFTPKKGIMTYGQVPFAEITGVIKSKTKGYIQVWAVNPENESAMFLGDYSPLDERPQFKQAFVVGCNPSVITDVLVQGRIKLKSAYTDNDIVPFDSINTIKFTAQFLQAEENNNINVANYKDNRVDKMIESEASYKRVSPGTPVPTFAPLSGGAVRGIVNYGRGWGYRFIK